MESYKNTCFSHSTGPQVHWYQNRVIVRYLQTFKPSKGSGSAMIMWSLPLWETYDRIKDIIQTHQHSVKPLYVNTVILQMIAFCFYSGFIQLHCFLGIRGGSISSLFYDLLQYKQRTSVGSHLPDLFTITTILGLNSAPVLRIPPFSLQMRSKPNAKHIEHVKQRLGWKAIPVRGPSKNLFMPSLSFLPFCIAACKVSGEMLSAQPHAVSSPIF